MGLGVVGHWWAVGQGDAAAEGSYRVDECTGVARNCQKRAPPAQHGGLAPPCWHLSCSQCTLQGALLPLLHSPNLTSIIKKSQGSAGLAAEAVVWGSQGWVAAAAAGAGQEGLGGQLVLKGRRAMERPQWSASTWPSRRMLLGRTQQTTMVVCGNGGGGGGGRVRGTGLGRVSDRRAVAIARTPEKSW